MKSFVLIFSAIFLYTSQAEAEGCLRKGSFKDEFKVIVDQLEIVDDKTGKFIDSTLVEKNINLIDEKNGYLELKTETIVPKVVSSLFLNKDGSKVIAATSDGVSVQNLHAFECKGTKWSNITKKFYPSLSYEKIASLYKKANIKLSDKFLTADDLSKIAHSVVRFKLPRQGRMIAVFSSHPDLEEIELMKFEP